MLTRLAIRRALHTTPRRSVAQPAAHTNTFDGIPSAREVMVDENLSEGKVKLALPVFVAGGSSLLGYVCYIQWVYFTSHVNSSMRSAPTVARLALRSHVPPAARRNLHMTAPRSTSHPAHSSTANGQSIGEDVSDTQAKNNAWPAFVAAGVAIVTYIGYSQVSAAKQGSQEKEAAPQDEQKKQYDAGEKPRTASRG
ncbi:hypothetical protein JCM1841_001115 [Sporobolomyces salmonicolor]